MIVGVSTCSDSKSHTETLLALSAMASQGWMVWNSMHFTFALAGRKRCHFRVSVIAVSTSGGTA